MSMINKSIPEFTAEAFHNGEFKTITTDDVKGKWSIFLFYPADFTFVCPTELEDMQKYYAELKDLGVEVYAVSTDTHFVHKAWHDHASLRIDDGVCGVSCAQLGGRPDGENPAFRHSDGPVLDQSQVAQSFTALWTGAVRWDDAQLAS